MKNLIKVPYPKNYIETDADKKYIKFLFNTPILKISIFVYRNPKEVQIFEKDTNNYSGGKVIERDRLISVLSKDRSVLQRKQTEAEYWDSVKNYFSYLPKEIYNKVKTTLEEENFNFSFLFTK